MERKQKYSCQKYQEPVRRGTVASDLSVPVPRGRRYMERKQENTCQKFQQLLHHGTQTNKTTPTIPTRLQEAQRFCRRVIIYS
jgi:hypothetical protein